ncbi:MAG: transglutaminase family protein [Betaproteobacteria bacterium]|nr:transglutaminase family protein [Betaproteobacteria bacterium]
MSIHVALNHHTRYRYERPVALSAHEVRLRPAPHCRTPILSYSLTVKPAKHFVNWQQDVYGNFIARYVFPEKTREFEMTVDLVADMTVINPFDFFVESYAEKFPFAYDAQLARDLAPFLAVEERGPQLTQWIENFRAREMKPGMLSIDFLLAVNRSLQNDIAYLVRMEPGVQTCEQTLGLKSGSCRDSGWLMVQILRHCGLAARFVSGYLIQLTADIKALDGPSGPERDFTDLHAWAEVYIPGAGWIGLDPTSGLLAGEGHIPLACTASPGSAAPVSGTTEPCESTFEFSMSVTRIREDPRVTKPYTVQQWQAIDALGHAVDSELTAGDVRLTQGGEPTFVSVDDMDGPEWNYTALSPAKLELAGALQQRMQQRLAPGALLHYGQGKWYPGEPLPRWALGIYWRKDGVAVWRNPQLVGAAGAAHGTREARQLIDSIAGRLGFANAFVMPAYEDTWRALDQESQLPVNVDPLAANLKDAGERARLAAQLRRGLGEPVGFVLPLRAAKLAARKKNGARWDSSTWPLRRKHLLLISGDSPLGYRLPLDSLPAVTEKDDGDVPHDPFAPLPALDQLETAALATGTGLTPQTDYKPAEIVRTALCVEPRAGCLYVYMPPLPFIEDYLALVATVEDCAQALNFKLRIEGYEPPADARMNVLRVTPDPGVIEVNIHPVATWTELAANTTALYEDARQTRLATEKFMLDGRHTGTGGGNHVTLGGATPADSPLLRRPDLIKSLLAYWQNHPALSYLFAGQFVGPTSQAPRVDEARDDNLYELEIAFQQMTQRQQSGKEALAPWLVDRLLRNLLVDLTGNTHRAEFCIDKLYSPDTATGRLGILEFRAFEMPPHAQMSLAQMLLLRALIARFWKAPYSGQLIRWGTQLHDRFMLPHFIAADMQDVVRDLNAAGYAFDFDWFAPFIEFRFPRYGTVNYNDIQFELRQAIEPWNVLGEEVSAGATARYVDSSVERLQVKVTGLTGSRYAVACNEREVPLHATGVPGVAVAGVRYRAWAPPSALHPTIGVQAPLVFDIVDTWSGRSIGGCTYHVAHPGGRNYETFPVNANEAEARRIARFWDHGHTAGPLTLEPQPHNPAFPLTLDLRWQPA